MKHLRLLTSAVKIVVVVKGAEKFGHVRHSTTCTMVGENTEVMTLNEMYARGIF